MPSKTNKKIIVAAIIIIVLALLVLISAIKNKDESRTNTEITEKIEGKVVEKIEGNSVTVSIDGNILKAEVADTTEKRTLGLSGRESLGENSALIFVFDTPGKYGFWMKDMNFPIDILWLNRNNKIIGITKNAKPEDFPEIYYPAELVSTVIETNAGWIEKNNISFESEVIISTE